MSLKGRFEKLWFLVAGVVLASLHYFVWPTAYPVSAKELFSGVVDISGIAVGFLATGQVLLCSLTDNFVVKTLRKYGRFEDMLRYFTVAIYCCLFLALFSLASCWTDFKAYPPVFSIWLGACATTFGATLRILLLFRKVLHGGQRD
jgi:hypothetical protein